MDSLQKLLQEEILVPVAFITLGALTLIIWIIAATLHSMMSVRAKEQTKRELAAYVAEGTLDPDKAVALLNANGGESEDEDEG